MVQSLWYGFQLNKKPGIALIFRKPENRCYLIRLNSLLQHRKLTDVEIWTIDETGMVEMAFEPES